MSSKANTPGRPEEASRKPKRRGRPPQGWTRTLKAGDPILGLKTTVGTLRANHFQWNRVFFNFQTHTVSVSSFSSPEGGPEPIEVPPHLIEIVSLHPTAYRTPMTMAGLEALIRRRVRHPSEPPPTWYL